MNRRTFISSLIVFTLSFWTMSGATIRSVPSAYATITAAITAAGAGDTVSVASGTYTETVTVNKSISLIGVSNQTTVLGSITISAGGVTCKDLRVQGTSSGITANNVSNLSLINMIAYGNAVYGASLNNIATLTISGGTYSTNTNHGISIANVTNATLTNVTADSNLKAGVQLYAVTGTNVLTNIVARKNSLHGLFLYYGTSGVTVQGGTFSNNGVNQFYDGGGIALDAGSVKTVSNININGPMTIQGNITCGIWLTASMNGDTVRDVVIGQSGTVSLTGNAKAGIIVYGNIHNTTHTATFTRGTAAAAGVLVIGLNQSGVLSPQTVAINNSTFSGYTSAYPAISLSSNVGHKSIANVSGAGNTFVGASTDAAIETLVYHKPDDAILGTVTLSNNNPVPVELVSFSGVSVGSKIELEWKTATEINNFGFDIERRPLGERSQFPWKKIGFVEGNGTTNQPCLYSFRDGNPEAGINEYRLKQIDHDGVFEYSHTVVINNNLVNITASTLEVYPNPFNATAQILVRVAETGPLTLTIYDMVGREMTKAFSGIVQGNSLVKVPLDAGELSSGIYYCVMHHNLKMGVKKLIILK